MKVGLIFLDLGSICGQIGGILLYFGLNAAHLGVIFLEKWGILPSAGGFGFNLQANWGEIKLWGVNLQANWGLKSYLGVKLQAIWVQIRDLGVILLRKMGLGGQNHSNHSNIWGWGPDLLVRQQVACKSGLGGGVPSEVTPNIGGRRFWSGVEHPLFFFKILVSLAMAPPHAGLRIVLLGLSALISSSQNNLQTFLRLVCYCKCHPGESTPSFGPNIWKQLLILLILDSIWGKAP